MDITIHFNTSTLWYGLGIGLPVVGSITSYLCYKIYPFYDKTFKPFINSCFEVYDDFKKRDFKKYTQSAPSELKCLASAFQNARISLEKGNILQAQQEIKAGCLYFFTTPYYSQFEEEEPCNDIQNLISLYQEAQHPCPQCDTLQIQLQTCQQQLQKTIARKQGCFKKIEKIVKNQSGKILNDTINHLKNGGVSPSSQTDASPASFQELQVLKQNLTHSQLPLNIQTAAFNSKAKTLSLENINFNNLENSVTRELQIIQEKDPEGFEHAKSIIGIEEDVNHLTSLSQTTSQQMLIAHRHFRKQHPQEIPLPPLPENLCYQKETTFIKEKKKLTDFFAFSFLWLYFSGIYRANAHLEKEFHDLIADSYFLSSKQKEKRFFVFFQNIHQVSSLSFIPFSFFWKGGCFLSSKVKQCGDLFLSRIPLFGDATQEIKNPSLADLTYLCEKIGRFFHFLSITHLRWNQHHVYEKSADSYLAHVLDQKQKQISGFPCLNCLKKTFDLTETFRNYQYALKVWVNTPSFEPTHHNKLSYFNPLIKAGKFSIKLVIDVLILSAKTPLALSQQLLNYFVELALKKILLHTPLVEKILEKIGEELQYYSPYKFAILEALLPLLQEIQKTLEQPFPSSHATSPVASRMKIALKEILIAGYGFAKRQESLDLSRDSKEMLLLEKITPFLIDIIYSNTLKIARSYQQKGNFNEQKKIILQAINFFIYHKKSQTAYQKERDALEERFALIKQKIASSFQKITYTLISETSKKELPQEIHVLVKKILRQSNNSHLSPLKQYYLERKWDLVTDQIKKPFLQKAFVLYLLS